jgi:arsenite methyltransferase
MGNKSTFFDFAAEVGLTKHIGGLESTQTMLERCHIGEGSYVLDVGCGVGVTPCYIARNCGCRVVGVDIIEKMVERSRERALREKVADRVEFRVADAQDLPFEDNLFDAVITESVTAFPEAKQKAVNEYVRVVKPGGYVGLNESTWLKFPPPQEMIDWASQEIGSSVNPLTSDEWTALLVNAGLRDVTAETLSVNLQDESKAILKRYGFGGFMKVIGRMLRLYFKDPDYKAFVKKVKQEGVTPPNLADYFGYGLYIGQK